MKETLLEKYRKSLPGTRPRPYLARAEAFLKWLHDREFVKENVQKWLQHLSDEGYADGTILHDFEIIRRLAIVNGIPWDFKRDEKPKLREIDIYTPLLASEDIKAMVECVRGLRDSPIPPRPEHRAFLALSTVYGVRRIEMLEVEPHFLDVKGKTIFIQTAKKGRQRYHLIPDNILPYLVDWGFQRRLSRTSLSYIFVELRHMIGLTAEEVGWHAIRRSAVAEAYRCGLSEDIIYSYYRWKRPLSNMPMRYATGNVVGTAGKHIDVPFGDRRVDEEVFKVHPFVKFWD